jgi:membrane protein required for colicin V production
MTATDWILLALGVASALWGLWRGLVKEVISLAGWIASFWLAQVYAQPVGMALPLSGSGEALRQLAGFVTVFLAVLIISAFLGMLLKKLASAVGLGPLDRLLGAVFGALRGLLLLLTLTIMVDLSPLHNHDWWQQSGVAQWLHGVLQTLRPLLPAEFGKYII